MSHTLTVKDLAVARGGRIVLRQVSFALRGGEALQVTGQNGAGKSTFLRALAGLLPATSGSIAWAEPEIGIAERAHYLGHADGLKGALTVRANLAFYESLLGPDGSGTAGRETPATALERLNLAHTADLPAAYLSAGQKRRVALARLLVAPRPLWLLDEPGTALDRQSALILNEIMAGHLRSGGLLVAATHAPLGLGGAQTLRLGS